MKLIFVYSHIFKYDDDNNFYSNGQFPYKVFEDRYLSCFDNIVVASRGEYIDSNKQLNLSSGPNVKHYILPSLSRIKNRNRNKKQLNAELETLIKDSDAVVARMPSGHAYHAIKIAKRLKKPYTVEIVGDVFAALWNHGSLFGKILAPIRYIQYKRIIKQSPYLIYVTQNYLQEIYPYKSTSTMTNASNVEISGVPRDILVKRIDRIKEINIRKEINIGLIGSYASKYKGIDTAIKSIKILNESGFDCKVLVLGAGNNKWLKDLSIKLGIESKVIFVGSLPGGEKVFEWLDSMDIYIQPSLTEGLPRSLIEAMSRGLPCVASSVGGIPELIDGNFIHKPKSENELSEKISYLLTHKEEMLVQAERNFTRANDYTADALNGRRNDFWLNFIDKEMGVE